MIIPGQKKRKPAGGKIEQLLERFYDDREELPESYFKEKEALKIQYEPHIEVTIINGGLFYLTEKQFHPDFQ